MNTKRPIRKRTWYAIVWCILLLISGAWTLQCAYWAYQLATFTPVTEQQGYGTLVGEALVIISIPVYILFIGLLFCFPIRHKKRPDNSN